ncbi:uncharacterized protein LOC128332502 isoform X2 [Hemicordylus capensis]|uniref:uncharacterized protein LOC128332502 isoform X2 n=1 Tax=Hemicordylus capensis TaxID=884348 RepID=UPI002302FE7B|nr:uncharacterized protein LOC128332502 isoform X2 [Hemicordylus capensis]
MRRCPRLGLGLTLWGRLRRVCRCCRKFFKTSPSSDSEKGKPPRGRFWPRSKQVEPTPAPPPTPSGGTPAVSGVTIGLTTIQEEVDRAEEIMEDVKKHPDPGFLLRLSLDAVTELTKMKPPMPFNLKAAVLNVAVSGLNQVDPGTQENMASFKKMLRGLLEEAPSVYSTIGILKELHRYIESEEPRLQALGREAYVYVLQHVARLPNVELTTHKALLRIEDDLTHHLIQSTIKGRLEGRARPAPHPLNVLKVALYGRSGGSSARADALPAQAPSDVLA